MATIDAGRLLADLAYVETQIAQSTVLQATKHRVFTTGQQVSVEVEGAHWEARAWRAVFHGRIFPSHVDRYGARRQLVVATAVQIQVVEHPKRGGDRG